MQHMNKRSIDDAFKPGRSAKKRPRLMTNSRKQPQAAFAATPHQETVSSIVPGGEECGICFDQFEERGVLDCCKHVFCTNCIDTWLDRCCRCPHCKQVVLSVTGAKSGVVLKIVEKRELRETIEKEEGFEDFYSHRNSLFARMAGERLGSFQRSQSNNSFMYQDLQPPSQLLSLLNNLCDSNTGTSCSVTFDENSALFDEDDDLLIPIWKSN